MKIEPSHSLLVVTLTAVLCTFTLAQFDVSRRRASVYPPFSQNVAPRRQANNLAGVDRTPTRQVSRFSQRNVGLNRAEADTFNSRTRPRTQFSQIGNAAPESIRIRDFRAQQIEQQDLIRQRRLRQELLEEREKNQRMQNMLKRQEQQIRQQQQEQQKQQLKLQEQQIRPNDLASLAPEFTQRDSLQHRPQNLRQQIFEDPRQLQQNQVIATTNEQHFPNTFDANNAALNDALSQSQAQLNSQINYQGTVIVDQPSFLVNDILSQPLAIDITQSGQTLPNPSSVNQAAAAAIAASSVAAPQTSGSVPQVPPTNVAILDTGLAPVVPAVPLAPAVQSAVIAPQPSITQMNNPSPHSPGFTDSQLNQYAAVGNGMGGMSSMGGMPSMGGMSSMGGMPPMGGMPGMGGMPPMGGMGGMPGMGGMSPMGGMPGMGGMSPMGGMPGMGGMSPMGGMSGMGGMSPMGGMPGMGGMSPMGGMPGMNPSESNGGGMEIVK